MYARRAAIGIGDVYLARGQLEKARKQYLRAGRQGKQAQENPAIARGDFARQVEDFTRRGEYEFAAKALRRWELSLPGDKLDGYQTLLKVRLLVKLKKYQAAIVQARWVAAANPKSQHVPDLLLIAAAVCEKIDKKGMAVTMLKKLIREYPESPCSVTAGEALKRIKSAGE